MLQLILETCTERGFVALYKDLSPLFEKHLPFGLNNSKYLVPEIHKSLAENNLKISNLDCISLSTGPGSYTGIRVGAAVAKGLAYPHNIPLVGLCTLQCFTPKDDGPFFSLIDAKIGGAYFIQGTKKGSHVEFLTPPMVKPLSDLSLLLTTPTTLVTPNAKRLQSEMSALQTQVHWLESSPNSLLMAKTAETLFKKQSFFHANSLPLIYLRKTQAEIEKVRTL